ncbi:fumarylacetoacetate hydrolase family protein [Azospirillum sp. A1-3]|uniref:fumarylacetoacetate hydrolase family protein n=1 Tax=Azospirillum sp. A1-3 TaxID=185874 RepID=UPI002076E96E|nr:fumarylacetoacetate hydrolase family protein [Azospirillum sp. A1-3]MCM8735409.1 fumarylacetoacetate hydrolase family protein [Azospirillum sp. A1-3]
MQRNPRYPDSIVGHGEALVRPKVSDHFDYEGELTVVIGKPGRHIPQDRALDHVAGYTLCNDGSIRDFQRHTTQFTPGKNFWRSGSIGPWIVTADEIPDPAALSIETRLNGVTVQRSPISDLIFPVPALIAYISSFTPLATGDVIAIGTPSGVGAFHEPPLWMKPGDRVEVIANGIGTLCNGIADEVADEIVDEVAGAA